MTMVHQRGREDGDHEFYVQPLSLPSFLSLPDLVHANIASFLRGGGDDDNSCLRVAEVSRTLLESYGGCLTSIIICHAEGRNPAHLAALLRRQMKVQGVFTGKQDEAISGLCQAIVQGCCAGVELIVLYGSDEVPIVTQEGLDHLAEALEANDALPKLKILIVNCVLPSGGLSKLAKALAGGTAPLLQKFHFDANECNQGDLDSIADMLQARTLISSYKMLESVEGIGNDDWFDEATLVACPAAMCKDASGAHMGKCLRAVLS
jgi:hypothetical protein